MDSTGKALILEGYRPQPLRKLLKIDARDPDVFPRPGPDPSPDPEPNPVPLPPPDPDPGFPLDPLPTPAPVY